MAWQGSFPPAIWREVTALQSSQAEESSHQGPPLGPHLSKASPTHEVLLSGGAAWDGSCPPSSAGLVKHSQAGSWQIIPLQGTNGERHDSLQTDFLNSCWKIMARPALIEKTSGKIQLERFSLFPAPCSILSLNTKHTARDCYLYPNCRSDNLATSRQKSPQLSRV